MNAFYRADYSGRADTGAGGVAFANGKIAGIDVAGGIYRGTYNVSSGGEVTGTLNLTFPQGGTLVTGDAVPAGAMLPITLSAKPDPQGNLMFTVNVASKPVTVKLTKIADL